MDTERREQLNLRVIRETVRSAMRGLSPGEIERTLERANQLLDQARRAATSEAILTDVKGLQRELDQRLASRSTETSG